MNNDTLAKYDGWQKKCRKNANRKLEVPAKSPQRICRNALSSNQIERKMKGEHRKIPDTKISPLSNLKPPSVHTPCTTQPSKRSKSKPILHNKIGIKTDSKILGKPPQTKDLLLLLLPNTQEAPPNKIG